MPRVRPLAKAAMTTLGGGARATVATYRLALPMKLNTMLPKHSASNAVVICGHAPATRWISCLGCVNGRVRALTRPSERR